MKYGFSMKTPGVADEIGQPVTMDKPSRWRFIPIIISVVIVALVTWRLGGILLDCDFDENGSCTNLIPPSGPMPLLILVIPGAAVLLFIAAVIIIWVQKTEPPP